MKQTTSQLKLSNNKKHRRKARSNIVPLCIAALIIAGGVATALIYANKDIMECKKEGCRPQPISLNTQALDQLDIESDIKTIANKEIHTGIDSLEDINAENNRLLLQRDLNRAINRDSSRIPFNYSEQDFCHLELLTKDGSQSISITKCSNYVYRRKVELALKDINNSDLPKKYDFSAQTIQLEVRITQ